MVMKWAACAAALLLGGCQLINAAEEPTDLYTITPKSTFEPDMPSVFWQLAVEVPNASAFLNTSRIAIAQSPTSSDYYAKTGWTDRAPLMVQTRIVDSFENSHKIIAVARESIGLRANYVLQSDLRNFEAMYFYGKPPIAHVRTGRQAGAHAGPADHRRRHLRALRAGARRQGAEGGRRRSTRRWAAS